MKQEEFRQAVKTRIGVVHNDQADEIIGAVLSTLSARISDEEAQHLAAQLPEPYKTVVRTENRQETFDLEEIFERIAGELRLGRGPATRYAQAVLDVLNEAVITGELQDVMAQLPDEFGVLFENSVG